MKRQENRAVLAWRGAASAGLDSSADRAYMKAPVPRPTLQLVDKVSRSCGHTPGKRPNPAPAGPWPVFLVGIVPNPYMTEKGRDERICRIPHTTMTN